MTLGIAIQGARLPDQVVTWLLADRTPLNLTGATLAGTINDGTTTRAIDGTLTVVDGPAGIFRWAYGVLDVGTAGSFDVQITATFAGGLARTMITPWRVARAQ
jgi:hypothetical protein